MLCCACTAWWYAPRPGTGAWAGRTSWAACPPWWPAGAERAGCGQGLGQAECRAHAVFNVSAARRRTGAENCLPRKRSPSGWRSTYGTGSSAVPWFSQPCSGQSKFLAVVGSAWHVRSGQHRGAPAAWPGSAYRRPEDAQEGRLVAPVVVHFVVCCWQQQRWSAGAVGVADQRAVRPLARAAAADGRVGSPAAAPRSVCDWAPKWQWKGLGQCSGDLSFKLEEGRDGRALPRVGGNEKTMLKMQEARRTMRSRGRWRAAGVLRWSTSPCPRHSPRSFNKGRQKLKSYFIQPTMPS